MVEQGTLQDETRRALKGETRLLRKMSQKQSNEIQELKEKTKELEEKLDILSHLLLDEIEKDAKPKKVPERVEYNPERCFWEGVVPLIVLGITFALMGLQSVGEKGAEPEPEYPVNFTEFRR